MLYAILCYNSEDVVFSWSKEEDDAVMAKLRGRAAEARRPRPLGPVAAADADHRGHHPAQGPRAAGDRRALRRDQGAAARLLCDRLRDLEEALETRPRAGARDTPAAPIEIRPLQRVPAGERRAT